MRYLVLFPPLFAFAFGAHAQAQPALDTDGFGAVKVGMTLKDASAASGMKIVSEGPGGGPCEYAAFPKYLGVGATLVGGRIASVSVMQGSASTAKGVRMGDPEKKVLDSYGATNVTATKSGSMRKLRTLSKDSTGATRELGFLISSGKVDAMWAGYPVENIPGKPCRILK